MVLEQIPKAILISAKNNNELAVPAKIAVIDRLSVPNKSMVFGSTFFVLPATIMLLVL